MIHVSFNIALAWDYLRILASKDQCVCKVALGRAGHLFFSNHIKCSAKIGLSI